MPRQPRLVIVGQPQHVIIRGNNRQAIFKQDQDYYYYLKKLADACLKHNCEVHAYVLMTNHVHLLITPNTEHSIAKLVQNLGRYYVHYFNKKYQRTGTLWEGRYKASLIDSENYAISCYRYIELNPVRAQIVKQPHEYPWSSYQRNALGKTNELVTPHALYSQLGNNQTQRSRAYRDLFKGCVPAQTVNELRNAINKSWILGSESFKQEIEQKLQRALTYHSHGGDRRSAKFKQTKSD
ncbi:MAG: transposase [Acidiferrobacterales bacterium]|nr:transposase [Acidiferrobacterales bacterium]